MLFILIFLIFSPFSTKADEFSTNSNAEERVELAIKVLTELSKTSHDTLSDLYSFAPQVAELLRTLNPLSVVIRRPLSTEYSVLVDFKNRTDTIWKDIELKNEIFSSAISEKISRLGYHSNVEQPMMIMKKLMDKFIDPDFRRYEGFLQELKHECKNGKSSPQNVLQYLRQQLLTDCSPVTPTEAQEIADHRAYLMRIFRRFQVENEPIPDPGLHIIEFLDIYDQLRNKEILYADLEVFDSDFTSYAEAIAKFFDELRSRASISKMKNVETTCPQRLLIYTTNFNYQYVEVFVSELRNKLIKLIYFSGLCTDLFHEEYYLGSISEDASSIALRTANWFITSLESSWPAAHNAILKEQIMRIDPKPYDHKLLKLVADVTHPLLMNTGKPNYIYEMFIVRDKENDIYFEGNNDCSLNKDAFGFDTIIGRIRLDSKNRYELGNLQNRMHSRRKDAVILNTTIQLEMEKLYDTGDLSSISKSLKEKFGEDNITQKDFRCWGIVRESAAQFFNKCPKIEYHSSPYSYVNLGSINILGYSNSGSLFQKCQEFRFFFFA